MWGEYFEQRRKQNGCNEGLSQDELSAFQKHCNAQLGFFLPFHYAEILKHVNGYKNKKKVLYAADVVIVPHKNKKNIPEYISKNFFKIINNPDDKYLYIGETPNSYFVFDYINNRYLEISSQTHAIIKKFVNFNALMKEIIFWNTVLRKWFLYVKISLDGTYIPS